MIHNETQELSNKELRNFGLVTAVLLVLFFDVLIPWIWDFTPPIWPIVIATVLALMALIFPQGLRSFHKVWMTIAEALGWINTRIILGFIFFVFFFPAGMLLRLFRDPMNRKTEPDSASYRITSQQPKTENLERPF